MIGGRFPSERGILIKRGYVLTLDPALGDLPDTDVLIEGHAITGIGRDLQAPPHANVIDARNRIVMPGFVDTHRHTWQTPVRGVLPSCTLDQYFAGMLDNIGRQYRAEDVYIANVDLPSLLRRLDAARDYLLSKAGAIPQWVLSRRD